MPIDPTAAVFDPSYLACGHHESILAGLLSSDGFRLKTEPPPLSVAHLSLAESAPVSLPSDTRAPLVHVALIGVGGGQLTMFLHAAVGNVHIDAVDLDEAVVAVAQSHFGFCDDSPRVHVYIGDGLVYMQELAQQVLGTPQSAFQRQPAPTDSATATARGSRWWRAAPAPSADDTASAAVAATVADSVVADHRVPLKDVIILDVDSKVLSTGLSCPPEVFVTVPFFECVKAALAPGGVFLLNLVCRSKPLFADILARARSVFESVELSRVPEDVNVVLICGSHSPSLATWTVAARVAALQARLVPDMRQAVDLATVYAAVEADPRHRP
jgi:spermidine synthase